MHRAAAEGYREVADRYERGRAGYPPDAVAALLARCRIGAGSRVVELGAGTGKFTEHLVASSAAVVAVEPVADMRRKLTERLPGVEVRAGTAEAIPAGAGEADAVVVAQAFHWFAGADALREIARVLRPGGWLGLIWNVTDRTPPWVDEIWAVIDGYEGDAPRYHRGDWKAAFGTTTEFTPLEHRAFGNPVPMTDDALVDRVLSISFIAARPDAERERVAAHVRRVAASVPPPLVLPYRTDVFWCQRAGSTVTTAL